MRNREHIFFLIVAAVFGTIAAIAYVVCWPIAQAVQLRDRVNAWRKRG